MGEKYADCDIVEMRDDQAYKALMVMNIQAQSLTEVEEAEGIKSMMERFEWSQERVSKEFGKAQRWISYRLSLLSMDEEVQEFVSTRVLTGTHAREIAQLPKDSQSSIARQVVEEKLSTRETAELVKRINHPQAVVEEKAPEPIQKIDEKPAEFNDEGTIFESENKQEPQIKPYTMPEFQDKHEEKRIIAVHDFLLKVKNFQAELDIHNSIIEDMVVIGRENEALYAINKITERLQFISLHITNTQSRPLEGKKGEVVAFKKQA